MRRDAAAVLAADQRQRRAKRGRHAVPQREVALGEVAQAAAQIVMTRKQPPRLTRATNDFKLDRRSPKTPPLERRGRHVDDPVGLEPLGHVVVARHGDEAAADAARANPLRHRRRNDPGDVAIDDGGEFVENDERGNGECWKDEVMNVGRRIDGRYFDCSVHSIRDPRSAIPFRTSAFEQCSGQIAAELLAVA